MQKNERLLKTMGIKTPEVHENPQASMTKTGPGLIMSQQKMAAVLEETQKQLEQLKSHKIPLAEIHEVKGRKRTLTDEAFDELKANLATHPLMHAIVVRKRVGDGYEIIAGHNRMEAYRQLGRKEIEAEIREVNDDYVFEASFYSNLFTSALSDFEKFEGFREIQNVSKETQSELAKRAGVSKTQISRLFSFEKLPPEALDIIRINPHCIGYSSTDKLSKAPKNKIIYAIKKLADGELNEVQAVKYALAKDNAPTKNAATPIIIRVGKKTFAEIISRKNGLIAVTLKDEKYTEDAIEKIKTVIEEMINNLSDGT